MKEPDTNCFSRPLLLQQTSSVNGHQQTPPSGGGITSLYELYRYMYVLPQGVGFLRRFGLKTGIRLCSFWSGTGYGFPGNCVSRYERIYRYNSKWVRKKEKYANSKWIFRNLFCCCSNLSCDEIISRRPGLRTGVKNDIFWSEIRSGFGVPGGTPPPRIPRSTLRATNSHS